MNLTKQLLRFLKINNESSSVKSPKGYCPNCWGRNEYGGEFYDAVHNNNLDINSKNPNIGWVQDYANKHLSEIALTKSKEGLVCPKCKLSYISR